MDETVEIDKFEYERLLDDRCMLDCLKACGVENWEGYKEARDMYWKVED